MSFGQHSFPGSAPEARRKSAVFTRGDAPTAAKPYKQVYPTSEIPHLWMHRTQSSARNAQRNLFFIGDTIYSYGEHFAIARHVQTADGRPAILLTDDRYSNTTAHHVHEVRMAIPDTIPTFFVHDPACTPLECMALIRESARAAAVSLTDAGNRKPSIAKAWRALQTADDRAVQFAQAFSLEYTSVLPADTANCEAIAIGHENAVRARAEVRNAAHSEKHRRQLEEYALREAMTIEEKMTAWRDGGSTFHFRFPECLLRISKDGADVETSLGATVPVDHVRKALPVVLAIIRNGRTYQSNGHTIHLGHYSLDSIDANGTVKAGCHTILRSEVERIAALLGIEN